jgi:hypothetical protein
MKRLAKWDELAEATWKSLPSQDQLLLANAVQGFVERNEGEWRLLHVHPDAYFGILYVDKYTVHLIVDRHALVTHVEWIHRRSG